MTGYEGRRHEFIPSMSLCRNAREHYIEVLWRRWLALHGMSCGSVNSSSNTIRHQIIGTDNARRMAHLLYHDAEVCIQHKWIRAMVLYNG